MAFINDIRAAEVNLVDRIWDALKTARAQSKRRRVYRHTLDELRSLSPRELGDLGISRNNIEDIAYEAAFNE